MAHPEVSVEDFRNFVCVRAFDIISEGRYKKYLGQCKEAGDLWAIKVSDSVNQVFLSIKHVNAAIEGLQFVQCSMLASVCREVMGSTSPPVRVKEGIGVCVISGVEAENCVDLGKSARTAGTGTTRDTGKRNADAKQGRTGSRTKSSEKLAGGTVPAADEGLEKTSIELALFRDSLCATLQISSAGQAAEDCPFVHGEAQPFRSRQECDLLVHPKFSHFFLLLWFVCKIDHVLRNYVRWWVDSLPDGADDSEKDSVQVLCDQFAEQIEFFENLCKIFNYGVNHIVTSLATYHG